MIGKYRIDLNADLGESAGSFITESDRRLLDIISSVNISCGAHAGTRDIIAQTIRLALEKGVVIGAHPSYPDRENFGRRSMNLTPEELYLTMAEQISLFMEIAHSEGGEVAHVKPHGALYSKAAEDAETAGVIIKVVSDIDPAVSIYGLSGSLFEKMAISKGIRFVGEVFADRAYNNDGSLVNRSIKGSVIDDPRECAARAVRMVIEKKVEAITGETISVNPGTICIHGDNPAAAEAALKLRRLLKENDIAIKPPHFE